ncbi:MAG: hypothetical protein ACLR5S_04085 [Ruminococcus sp.]
MLCDIRKAVCIPVVAIGGITAQHSAAVQLRIDGVAWSPLFGQPDVTRAARNCMN